MVLICQFLDSMFAYNQISVFSYPFFNKAPRYCWALGFYGLNLSLVFTYRSQFFAFSAEYPESRSWVSREEETRERQFSCVYWLHQTRWPLRSDIGGRLSIFSLAKTELICTLGFITPNKPFRLWNLFWSFCAMDMSVTSNCVAC